MTSIKKSNQWRFTMITKYDSYHTKIENDLQSIIEKEGFEGDGANSKAFGFWFLKHYSNLSEEDINEGIIDGSEDNGIDAYIYMDKPEKTLELFQFKFPEIKNVKNEINKDAILKIFDGISILINPKNDYHSKNAGFNDLLDFIKDTEVYKININFVSYNAGIIDTNNIELINRKISDFKQTMQISYKTYNADDIINLYDKMQRKNSVSLSLGYVNMQSSYSIEGSKHINSWVGVIQAKKLLSSVTPKLAVIFDENIRLFERDSSVNEKITLTAKDARSSNMFYFYNNGITVICDQAKNSPGTSTMSLEGASIVNGCQTVTSLATAYNDHSLQDDVNVLIRIIEINTYEERSLITQYLNSQNTVKESYFIANNHIVRDLQQQLLKKGYFLERQINELSYRKQYGNNVSPEMENATVLKLEDTVQHYVGAYINKDAAQAKRGKGALFDRNHIEDRLKDATAERVIEAEVTYSKVSKVVTKYRKNRRSKTNHEFTDYLGISPDEYVSDEYSFVNTGDILILNAVTLMTNPNLDEKIKKAIILIKNIVKDNDDLSQLPPATMTKRSQIYSEVQNRIIKQKADVRKD